MKLSSLKIDSAKLEAGAWVKDLPGCGDLAVKVRSYESRAARDARAKATSDILFDRRKAGLSAADQDAVSAKVAAEALLIDVKNFTDDDGVELTVDQARALLGDPDYAALLGAITWAASVMVEKGVAELAADVGN